MCPDTDAAVRILRGKPPDPFLCLWDLFPKREVIQQYELRVISARRLDNTFSIQIINQKH